MYTLKESIDNVLPVVEEGLDIWLKQRTELRNHMEEVRASHAESLKNDIRDMFVKDGLSCPDIPLEIDYSGSIKIGDIIRISCYYALPNNYDDPVRQTVDRFDIRWGNSSWGRTPKGDTLETLPLITSEMLQHLTISAALANWATPDRLEQVIHSISDHLYREQCSVQPIKYKILDLTEKIEGYIEYTITHVINPMMQYDMDLSAIVPDYYNKRFATTMSARFRKLSKDRVHIFYATPAVNSDEIKPKLSSITRDEWIKIVRVYIGTAIDIA